MDESVLLITLPSVVGLCWVPRNQVSTHLCNKGGVNSHDLVQQLRVAKPDRSGSSRASIRVVPAASKTGKHLEN